MKNMVRNRPIKSAKEEPEAVFTEKESVLNSYYFQLISKNLRPYPKIFLSYRNGNAVLEIGNNPIDKATHIDLSNLPEQVALDVVKLLVKSKTPITVEIGGATNSEGKENSVIITDDYNLGYLFKENGGICVLVVLNTSIQHVDINHYTKPFTICPSGSSKELLNDVKALSRRLVNSGRKIFNCPPRDYMKWLEIPEDRRAKDLERFIKDAQEVLFDPALAASNDELDNQ